MKKLYAIIFTLFLSVGLVIGQEFNFTYTTEPVAGHSPHIKNNQIPQPFVFDTIWDYYDRATAFNTYAATSGGYVALSNAGVTETGQRFDLTGNASVTGVLLWIYKKRKIGTADAITINVYAANPADGLPLGTSLGASGITTDDIDTTGGNINNIVLASPVPVTGNFIVSVTGLDVPGKDDTLALVFNGANDGMGEQRAVQKLAPAYGGMWNKMNTIWGTWNSDAMIIPIIDVTAGVNSVTSKGLTLMGAYPNPTNEEYTTIKYSLKESSVVTSKVFDLAGRTIQESTSELNSGEHTVKVSVTNIPAGTYYYTVQTKGAQLTSKFSVVK